MVVIGGAGNIPGVILGAILLTYLPERFRAIEEWRNVAFGVALVVVMILRPQGLWPSRRRAAELKDRQERGLWRWPPMSEPTRDRPRSPSPRRQLRREVTSSSRSTTSR